MAPTDVHNELDALMQLRDEMKTRVAARDPDLREQWEDLERKWDEIAERLGASEPDAFADDTTRALLDDIRDGYEELELAEQDDNGAL